MRRLSQKRPPQTASLIFASIVALFTFLWAVRGLRPAIACGLLDALGRLDLAAAFTCFDRADYEALLAFVVLMSGWVFSVLAWIASRKAPDTPRGEYHPTTKEQDRNRKGMIDRVWNIWIEGHLDQTLYPAVPLSLGMTFRPATPRPGSVRLRRAGEAERPVPEHVSTVQLFDEAGHMLLILGEPGSGKSTMMLDLARSLLERARTDESTPIPVVFNLSSLTDPEQFLDDWLVSEFRSNYQVPEKVARYWLAHDELALLLDGLDEVKADRRAGVVKKIEQYRSQHMDPWLVVCCRQNEYAELVADEAAVEGADAVVLEPLTPDQIRRYLVEELKGDEPKRLWRALQDDDVLLALADTPLMLNVMLLAAEQLDWSALPSELGREAVRSHIYNAYIRSMLARPRNTGKRYPDYRTLRWLPWLAGKMVEHGQSEFLLERTKRSWFNRPWQRHIWALVVGLIVGLVVGLPSGLIGGLLFGLPVGLLFGLFAGLLFGLFFGFSDIDVREQIGFRFRKRELTFMMAFVLIFGLTGVLLGGLPGGLLAGLLSGLLCGLFLGLLGGLINQTTYFESDYETTRPNAAIHQSLRNGLLSGLLIGLVSGLLSSLPFGLFYGLFFGLFFGLDSVIKHYTLRLILFLDGSMPLRYVRFLDYCVDRVLLRRVGGGYMFIHRTMMEHIAGLDLEKWKEQPDSP